MASESVAEQHSEPDEVTDESLFLTSSAASRRHLVYPAGFGADRVKKSVLLCYRLSAEDRRPASIFPRSPVVAQAALTDYGNVRKFAFLRKLQANISDCKILCLYMFAVIHSRVPRFATLTGEGSFDSDFLALPHSV